MNIIVLIIIIISILLTVPFYICANSPKSDFTDFTNVKRMIYKKILIKTSAALNRLNIPIFLSSGTCLGYFRDGKIIDHDYDVDVGIFAKDYTPKIVDEMKKEGFVNYRTLGDPETGLELSFKLPDTEIGTYAKIDIFLHYDENVGGKKMISWYSYKYPKFTEKIKYRVSKFGLKKVKFMGMVVNVPDPTLRYIEDHYGKEWMVPKKPFSEYNYFDSPVSIVK